MCVYVIHIYIYLYIYIWFKVRGPMLQGFGSSVYMPGSKIWGFNPARYVNQTLGSSPHATKKSKQLDKRVMSERWCVGA